MTPCDHLKADIWPLTVDHVFSSLITFAEALVSCRVCQRRYLLELLDVRAAHRLYRMSQAQAELADGLLHNLNRGSCDLSRAQAEFNHFRTQCEPLSSLLWVDTRGPLIIEVVETQTPPPRDAWQTLACDGVWFDRLGLKT